MSLTTLVVIVVSALLPAQLIAEKDVPVAGSEGATASVETPYALVPAGVQPVADRVSYGELADDIEVDTDLAGRVFFVTISEPAQSVLGWWVARNEPEIDFLTYDEKFGGQTPSQLQTFSLEMMRTSGQVAQYVALTRAGFDATIVPGAVIVAGPICLEAIEDRCTRLELRPELQVGDQISGVNDTPVQNLGDLSEALADAAPGEEVRLDINRPDEGELSITLELIESELDPGRGLIGFQPFDTASVDLPFEIEIATGQIGGPSAGLAFTLTLIDELTDGDLLGDLDVAVTGTIELDGSVGPIGGVPQKASAVRQAGIDYFIVPVGVGAELIAEAREIAGEDVQIIPVATIDEAIAALEELGGDPLTS